MTKNVRILSSLAEINAKDWDAVANPEGAKFNPFVSHAFLSALEHSGSATAKTGWAARHVVVEKDGEVTGVTPCYLKSHSQGEYVFDHGWADAFARAGGHYYPKLQVCIPFSPVVAPKLTGDRTALAEALLGLSKAEKASSVHLTFTAAEDQVELRSKGQWLERHDIQFHWQNNGYKSFEDFLTALSSNKRKNLRRERAEVLNAGVTHQVFTGDDIKPHHWDAFWTFYMDTGSRKWGRPYLTRAFFEMMHETMRHHILLVLGFMGTRPISGALNFIGGDTLYGRNWGCTAHVPFLHFETCYYQAIDWAIANKFRVIEAGAQGEHKLARGYVPVKTVSFHHLAHPGLQRAVADYLQQEREAIEAGREELAAHAPFRHGEQD